MELLLERKEFFDDRTIGGLYNNNGKFKWYVLEDKDRKLEDGGTKIYGQTAIPRGRYKLEFAWSEKRNGLVPTLIGVPQFIAVQIHIGNKPEDTEGCLLLGDKYDSPTKQIRESKNAIVDFYMWLLGKIVETGNNVWLNVK